MCFKIWIGQYNMICSLEFFSIEVERIDDWEFARKLFGCNVKEHISPKITENIRILKYLLSKSITTLYNMFI